MCRWEPWLDVSLELGLEQRGAFLAAPVVRRCKKWHPSALTVRSISPLVSDRVQDLDLVENGTVIERDGQSVANGSGVRVVVVGREEIVLNALHLQ